jgi:hypothetical protein
VAVNVPRLPVLIGSPAMVSEFRAAFFVWQAPKPNAATTTKVDGNLRMWPMAELVGMLDS